MAIVVFFFQAEDGIRDLVRSRGLGDVYKRQPDRWAAAHLSGVGATNDDNMLSDSDRKQLHDFTPVSYTHLTLPTSDLV